MSYIQYAIESPAGTTRRTGCDETLACKMGGETKQTITTTGTVTKATANKLMPGNLQFGSSSVIGCANKVMPNDIVIKSQVVSGNRYQEFTESGTWTIPPGVTSINVVCVGGGGGSTGGYKGPDYYDRNWQCGGAGGGYVNRKTISVTPGQTATISVGTGGTRGYASYYTEQDVPATDGGDSVFSCNGTTLTAGGGKKSAAGAEYAGAGGSGGGGGYYYKEATVGGYNGSDGADGENTGSYRSYGGKGQISSTGPNGETGNTTANGYVYSAGGGGYGGASGRGGTGDCAATGTGDGACAPASNGYGYNGGSGKVIVMW